MNIAKIIAVLFVGMAFLSVITGAYADSCSVGAKMHKGSTWLATGTVTKIDGSNILFLGKNNQIYQIDAEKSSIIFDKYVPNSYSVRVGDKVRVYGKVVSPYQVKAKRIRVLETKEECKTPVAGVNENKEVKIVIDKQPTEPSGYGAGVEVRPEAGMGCVTCGWEGQGLVTDINYTGRQLRIQTSDGNFTINIRGAVLADGSTRISLGTFNAGDTVRVTGTLVGLNEINAQQVKVLRTVSAAQNTLPMLPVSTIGIIQNVDYASSTFRMQTENNPIVVSCDRNTVIQHYKSVMEFSDLRPGMKVKMSGYGSIATGYAAQHVMIVSVSP